MRTRTRTSTGMTDWALGRVSRPLRLFGGKEKHLANRLQYVDESLPTVKVTRENVFQRISWPPCTSLRRWNYFRWRVFATLRYFHLKESRFSPWKLSAVWFGFYELRGVQSRVSCRETRSPSPCCSPRTAAGVQMWAEEYLQPHGRPMHAPQTSCLPMQAQWCDSAIWPTGFCSKPGPSCSKAD